MLTKEQIDYLFDFCRVNGVKPYDVQVELVDHLANGIEKELAELAGASCLSLFLSCTGLT